MTEPKDSILTRTIRSSYISSIVSTTLVLFLLGMLGILLLQAYRAKNYVKENHLITLFLQPDVAATDINTLIKELQQNEAVKQVKYISKEEAAQIMQEELGDDFISTLGYNPLNPSIEIFFNADYVDNTVIDHFKNIMRLKKQVKEVVAQQSLVERINQSLEKISLIVIILSTLLGFVAIILINNTIRLTLYAKRMLIRSMQLVGATRAFIQKPFLVKAIINGMVAALLSSAFLILFVTIVRRYSTDIIVITDIQMWLSITGILTAISIGISLICTFFAVNKWLNKPADAMF